MDWWTLDSSNSSIQLAAGAGSLWQLDEKPNHEIWCYAGYSKTWVSCGANTLTTGIAAGGDRLYQIRSDGQIFWHFKQRSTPWVQISNPSDSPSVKIVAQGDQLYRIDLEGKVFRHGSIQKWSPLGGAGAAKIVCGGGDVYGLEMDGSINRYSGIGEKWTQVDPSLDTKDIAAGGGQLYKIREDGAVYRYNGGEGSNSSWVFVDNCPTNSKLVVSSSGALYRHSGIKTFALTN